MSFIFSPAISLSNKLAFKAKFSVLALIFFIPIIASAWWIVASQWQRISQYDLEIEGLGLIKSAVMLEQSLHEQENVNSQAIALRKQVSNTSLADELASASHHITQQAQEKEASLTSYQQRALMYEKTLTFRENAAALSGLRRESNASAFYLAAMVVQGLPALTEYLARTGELTRSIIENDGFTAESYTLLVALDKRLDELQMQLGKVTLFKP